MTTAEAMRDEDPPQDESVARSRVPPSSPGLAAAWLLRTAAFAAVAAGVAGVIVAPGVRGNASETVVERADLAASALSYFLVAVLVALVIWAGFELVRTRGVALAARVALVGGGSVAVTIACFGLRQRLIPDHAVLLSAVTVVAAITGAYASARAPHTRALAGILLALAFAAIARLGAFELARAAGERASVQLYGWSRGMATAGVLFEGFAQLVCVTWLGTRSKLWGQLGATVALVGAFALTWGVAHGEHSGAALWEAMLHTALGDAAGIPPPYKVDAVAVFVVPASLLLAFVSAAQPRQVVVVVAAVAMALVSRGAFDAPLRALCAVAAAQWATLACHDERAMWRTLVEDRRRKMADDGVMRDPPPRAPPKVEDAPPADEPPRDEPPAA